MYGEETIIYFQNSCFENNVAKPRDPRNNHTYITGGVMVAFFNCVVHVDNSTFYNNSGLADFQGVFFVIGGTIIMHKWTFLASIGSVVYASLSNVTDTNSSYRQSNSTDGSVLFAKRSTVRYFGCNFTDNYAFLRGGVVLAEADSVLMLKGCYLSNNVATFGGAIAVDSCTTFIIESKFCNHEATVFGGALHVIDSGIRMSGVIMHNNSARLSGSAIYINGCFVSLTSITIINHPPTVSSKGVFYAVSCKLTLMEKCLYLRTVTWMQVLSTLTGVHVILLEVLCFQAIWGHL